MKSCQILCFLCFLGKKEQTRMNCAGKDARKRCQNSSFTCFQTFHDCFETKLRISERNNHSKITVPTWLHRPTEEVFSIFVRFFNAYAIPNFECTDCSFQTIQFTLFEPEYENSSNEQSPEICGTSGKWHVFIKCDGEKQGNGRFPHKG